jgi:hypothetical protein
MHKQVAKSYDKFYSNEKYYFSYIFMSTKYKLNQISFISKGTNFRVLHYFIVLVS